MQSFNNHPIGVDHGDLALFSDFENGGEMWTGTGPRERVRPVVFSATFRNEPVVQISVSLWDADTEAHLRAEVQAENITCEGFDAVFRTWADTRIARVRIAWMAIGELPHDDDWDLY